jgi:hypothetical protein
MKFHGQPRSGVYKTLLTLRHVSVSLSSFGNPSSIFSHGKTDMKLYSRLLQLRILDLRSSQRWSSRERSSGFRRRVVWYFGNKSTHVSEECTTSIKLRMFPCSTFSPILKIEAAFSTETSVNFHQIGRCPMKEDITFSKSTLYHF